MPNKDSSQDLYVREVFYNNQDSYYTIPQLSEMLQLPMGDVYEILQNLINRNYIVASWDTTVSPRKRRFKFKK